MPKYGENIYHRKDGRWEARYIAMRLPNGKAKYKSVYGRTHDIAKKKQLAAMQALTHESTAACELTLGSIGVAGSEFMARYLEKPEAVSASPGARSGSGESSFSCSSSRPSS